MITRYLAAPALLLVLIAGCDSGTTTPPPSTPPPVAPSPAAGTGKPTDVAPPASTAQKAL